MTMPIKAKQKVAELALVGGKPLFERPRSTSNLVRPNVEAFLGYSRKFFETGQLTNGGPLVVELEQRLAKFHRVRHCVSFCSGFWGLVLAIQCLARSGRREVIMPSLTYRRMGDVVAWTGLVPRFCDVDRETLALSPATVAPHIGPDTALILGVHPIVNCCDAPGLEDIAAQHGIPLLFDSVESLYESIGSRKVGTFGLAECFSLHASKLMNGFEGGYVATNDSELAERLACRRAFGFTAQDTVSDSGINAKLNEVHAAMALASLDDIEAQVVRNLERYRAYQHALKDLSGVRLVTFDEGERCAFKNIVVELTEDWPLERGKTLALLNAEGVLARAYYAPPLHMKKTDYPCITEPLPNTEYLATRFMLMPCGHLVDAGDIQTIAELMRFIGANITAIMKEKW